MKANLFFLTIALLSIGAIHSGSIFQIGEPIYNYANADHTT